MLLQHPTDALRDHWMLQQCWNLQNQAIPMLPGVIVRCCKIRRLLYFLKLQGVLRVGDSAQPGRERVPVEVHLPARQRSLLRQLRRHLSPHRNSARAHEVTDPNLIIVAWIIFITIKATKDLEFRSQLLAF